MGVLQRFFGGMEDADRDNDVSMEGGDPTPSSEQEPTEGGDHSMDSSVDDEEASASQPDPEASVERVKKQQRQKLRELREQQKKDLEVEKSISSQDRFQYLLKQAEIFRHFIEPPGDADTLKEGGTEKRGRRSKAAEKAEDQMLVQQAMDNSGSGRLTSSPPFIKGGEMRYYQIQGLNWMIQLHDHGINGILADEMGLGKTLQTISLLGYLKNVRGQSGPHLVIVPKSTLANWNKEFHRWCPSLSTFVLHGDKAERAELRTEMLDTEFDVLITTYEMAIIEKAVLKKYSWRYVVIDEAHRIKNENSNLARVVRTYNSNHRLLITGTPLQNNLHELWALLNFLLPDVFSSSENFDEWFNMDDDNNTEMMEKLHRVLKPFLLRRLKSEVEKSLPPKKEVKLYIGMTDMQREWYTNILSKNIDVIQGASKDSRVRLLNILMQLRKCCNHPYLFQGAEPGPPYTTGPHLINNSGKFILLDRLLARLKEMGSRVLIFSQMTRVLDILEDYMFYREYEYCRIDGSTDGHDREDMIERFNAPGSEIFTFLLSTRAGGLGINLATADTVILFDSDWNPQMDLQAQDRAHRIGQKKPVNVYRFVTQNTVEEKVVERAEAKLYLDALVIQQGRLVETNKSLSKNELMGMIKFGADEAFQCKSAAVTDADIDTILHQGEAKTAEANLRLQKNANNLLNFSLEDNMGDISIYEFMGVDFKQNPSAKSKAPNVYVELPQREKRKNYTEDEYYGEVFGRKRRRTRKKNLIKPPKQPQIQDFQFYPKKLKTILKKEMDIWKKQTEQAEKRLERRQKRAEEKQKEKEKAKEEKKNDEETATEASEASESSEESSSSDSEPDIPGLTEKQLREKDRLIERGFGSWTKKEFTQFCRACEAHGREAFEEIASDIGTKTLEEVEAYAKVFWKEYRSLPDGTKIVQRIEDGENALEQIESMVTDLKSKVESCDNPEAELHIPYPASWKKNAKYQPEEDRYLLVKTNELGYGNWEEVKQCIRDDVEFRYNWFLKSRSPDELAEHVDKLLALIEKEASKKESAKKSKGKAKSKPKGKSTGKRKSPPSRSPPGSRRSKRKTN